MDFLAELSSRVGYDSPNSGEYMQIPVINDWLGLEAKKRFETKTVRQTVGFAADGLGENNNKLSNADKSKINLCGAIIEQIDTLGREAPFFVILEKFKIGALPDVLQNERVRESINKSDLAFQRLDETVTFQVLSYFFSYFDKKEDLPEETTTENPLRKFSAN